MLFLLLLLFFSITCVLVAQEPMHYVIGEKEFEEIHLYSILQDDADKSVWITSNRGIQTEL